MKWFIVALTVGLPWFTVIGGESAAPLLAGAARADLTPPMSMQAALGGYGARLSKPAAGVHDAIQAKALVLAQGQRRFALVTADLLAFPPRFKAAVVERMTEFGWEADRILLLPSHSHTSIDMMALHPDNSFGIPQVGIFHRDLFDHTVDRLAGVIREAEQNLEAVAVGTKVLDLPNRNRNRRQGNTAVDTALTLTRFDTLSGSPLAALVHWTAHPTFMDAEDMLFSGGWPGHLQRTLEALIGDGVTVLYFNGAEGDQSAVPPESATSNWERAERYGRELGIQAWRSFQSVQPEPGVRLAYATEHFPLPGRAWHPDFLKTGGAEYGLDETMMQGFVDHLLPAQTHSTALAIGNLQILGVPGEMTAELGLLLKSRFQPHQPNARVVVGGLADEWISYILSSSEYRRGGYEASMSYYGEQLGNTVVDGVLRAASRCVEILSPASGLLDHSGDVATKWPRFRGPRGSGVADGQAPPTVFGPETNLLWKAALPPGQSSPCLWNSRLFITAAEDDELHTLCLDAHSGEELWRRTLPLGEGERGSGLGGPAAPSCCTDGQRVYAYSGPFGIAAYRYDGEEVWRRPLPTPVTSHGVGSSPVLAGNLVILLRDQDADSHLLALNAQTGETVWRTARPEFRRGFSTPLVVSDGQDSMIIAPGTLQVVAYQAADGQELWRASGLPNEICSSPVGGPELILVGGWTSGSGVPRMPDFDSLLTRGDGNDDGRLDRAEAPGGPARQHFHYIDANRDGTLTREEYEFIEDAFNRSRNALMAIHPGGQGDVTASRVLWTQSRGLPYVPTPLLYRGRVYLVKNGGMLTCLDAVTGAFHYREERLNVLGDNYASPVAAGGRIFVASRTGTVAVVQDGESLQVLARNPIGESIIATPAIGHETLFVRTEKHLWAFRGPG